MERDANTRAYLLLMFQTPKSSASPTTNFFRQDRSMDFGDRTSPAYSPILLACAAVFPLQIFSLFNILCHLCDVFNKYALPRRKKLHILIQQILPRMLAKSVHKIRITITQKLRRPPERELRRRFLEQIFRRTTAEYCSYSKVLSGRFVIALKADC